MIRLIKQASVLTLSNVLTKVVGVVFFIILARSMSVGDYGLFRYLLSLSMVYAIFFSGFPTALTKFISEDKANPAAVAAHTTHAIILMSAIFIILFIPVIMFQTNSALLILLIFSVLIDAAYLGFARGLLNYTKLAGYKLIENIIQLSILIISYFVFGGLNFTFAVIFFSFSGLASLLIFEAAKPELRLTSGFSTVNAWKLTKFTLPVALGSVGWTLMFSINPILIKRFQSVEQVGFYSVGLTLVQVFSFFPDAVATITMPKVAASKNRRRVSTYLNLSALGTVAISAVILLFLLVFKGWILTTLFTAKYNPALAVILPLSIAQIFNSIGAIYASAWQGLNKPGIPSIIVSIGAAVNLVAGYLLIGRYGIVGASVSLMLASLVSFIIIFIMTLNLNLSSAEASVPADDIVAAS